MIRSEEHWRSLTDAFHSAAINADGWYGALEGLAEATGSKCGELIGLGSNAAVPFNIVTNIDPEFEKDFVESGGGDPRLNPRVNAGMAAPVLKVLAESDYMTADEHKRHPFCQGLARRWDVAFSCLTTLERQDGMLIGLAVLRSQREGHITDDQRAAFTSIAPFVRAAVRTQIALEGQGTALLTGAMEALSIPVFICDRGGRVKALTPEAEAVLRSDCPLELKAERFHTAVPADAKALRDAIQAVSDHARLDRPTLQTVVIRGGEEYTFPLILDVVALLPRQYEFSFEPRVLIVVRGPRNADGRETILRVAYGLTAAETDIALQLSVAGTADAIASRRCVSVGTVRTQIKAILAKMGMTRQIELVARLNQTLN